MGQKRFRSILREELLKEVEKDEEIVNRLLDKISKQGQESLSPEEKKYMDQASGSGDVNPEVDAAVRKDSDVNSHVIHNLRQGDIDDINMDALKNASQSVIDEYVDKLTELGRALPPELVDKASEEAIGRNMIKMVNIGFFPPDVLKQVPVPQNMIDQFIMKSAEEGKELPNDIVELGSLQAKEDYRSKMG